MATDNDTQLSDAVTKEFAAAGYTADHIKTILDRQDQLEHEQPERQTWSKVHRRDVLPETLITYRLPWEWDEEDDNYILIGQWISEDLKEELYKHTQRLRDRKLLELQKEIAELKINDRKKDKMYLMRKKDQSRRH